MNTFCAIGRIGRDAVVRVTQSGKSVAGWALAVDCGFGDNKQTVWVDCSMWGDRGAKLAEHIRKGDRLGVTGELGTREHEGKTYVTLNVREVTLLAVKREAAPAPPVQRPKPAPSPQPATAPQGAADFADDDIPFQQYAKRRHW